MGTSVALPKILVTRDLSSPVFPVSGWPRCFEPVPRCSRGAGALLPWPQSLLMPPKRPSSDRQPGEKGCSCLQATRLAGSRAQGHRQQQLVPGWMGLTQGVWAPAGSTSFPASLMPRFELCRRAGARLSLSLPFMQAHCWVMSSPCPNHVSQQAALAGGEKKCRESYSIQPS